MILFRCKPSQYFDTSDPKPKCSNFLLYCKKINDFNINFFFVLENKKDGLGSCTDLNGSECDASIGLFCHLLNGIKSCS